MGRKNLAIKQAVMVIALTGMMATLPAVWAEEKGEALRRPADRGPTEEETVNYLNALLTCDLPRKPSNYPSDGTIDQIGGVQLSTLSFEKTGEGRLSEDATSYWRILDLQNGRTTTFANASFTS